MDKIKGGKIYLLINIPLIALFFILLFAPLLLTDNDTVKYYIGIVCRVTLGLWCIFNGVWNSCTDYYSILKNNKFQRTNTTPKWAWLILFILGVGCLITAFMGYGFNNVQKPV